MITTMIINTVCVRATVAKNVFRQLFIPLRWSNTLSNPVVEEHRKSCLSHTKEDATVTQEFSAAPRDYKYVYPDFLPNPDIVKRDRLCERLQRQDMLRRRAVIEIPEFYVGSILAVVAADFHAPGKQNRFVGICIQRAEHGLRANFTLRNVIDGQGVEIRYDLYNPALHKIDVLKLEKRLDDELFYLRDAPPEYSTFSFDMEPSPLPPGLQVPVNSIKVKLGPRPWHERWERKSLKGVEDMCLPHKFYERAKHPQIAKPWEKFDIMKKYRESINDVEADKIACEVFAGMQEIHQNKQKLLRTKLPSSPDNNNILSGQ
jgi:large subunit ribosomal protein L19